MLDTITVMAGTPATQRTAQFTEEESPNLTQRLGRQGSSPHMVSLNYALVPVVATRSKSLAWAL